MPVCGIEIVNRSALWINLVPRDWFLSFIARYNLASGTPIAAHE